MLVRSAGSRSATVSVTLLHWGGLSVVWGAGGIRGLSGFGGDSFRHLLHGREGWIRPVPGIDHGSARRWTAETGTGSRYHRCRAM